MDSDAHRKIGYGSPNATSELAKFHVKLSKLMKCQAGALAPPTFAPDVIGGLTHILDQIRHADDQSRLSLSPSKQMINEFAINIPALGELSQRTSLQRSIVDLQSSIFRLQVNLSEFVDLSPLASDDSILIGRMSFTLKRLIPKLLMVSY
jgi:hypothetical protein